MIAAEMARRLAIPALSGREAAPTSPSSRRA